MFIHVTKQTDFQLCKFGSKLGVCCCALEKVGWWLDKYKKVSVTVESPHDWNKKQKSLTVAARLALMVREADSMFLRHISANISRSCC